MKRRWRFAIANSKLVKTVRLDTRPFVWCISNQIHKNELASAATGTSSEVSKDTNSTHLDDSTLLDICQEGLCTVAQTRNADYQIGYADAVLDAIKKLRGEQSD